MARAEKGKPEDRDEPPEPPKLALTIREFCDAHGFSPAMFFKLKSEGKGPLEFRLGSKVLISHESAAVWRRAREADTEASTKAKRTWDDAHGVLRGPRTKKPEPVAASLTKPGKRKYRPKPRAKLAEVEA